MAKFKGHVACISTTNIYALYYIRYLCQIYLAGKKNYEPVGYYDHIDKKRADEYFSVVQLGGKEQVKQELENTQKRIEDFAKTVYHGFHYNIIEECTDIGRANKVQQENNSLIKNKKEPYTNFFEKYDIIVSSG